MTVIKEELEKTLAASKMKLYLFQTKQHPPLRQQGYKVHQRNLDTNNYQMC